MALGLDLRGGAHLLLEVDRDSLVEDRIKTLEGDIRQTLRDARIGYRGLVGARQRRDCHPARAGRCAEGAGRAPALRSARSIPACSARRP